ncbi:MAG: hypothetical protein HKL88_07560 [Bacteroidia bacterium]|nr:hypothetical protein [Bacteroidia bacterium]
MKTHLVATFLCLSLLGFDISFTKAQRHDDFLSDSSIIQKYKAAPKSDITFGFFSPINQHLTFGYEHVISNDWILSGHLGIIGPGFNLNTGGNFSGITAPNPSGAFASCGAKLFFNEYRYEKLQGFYIMPEIVAGYFNYYSAYYINQLGWWGSTITVKNGVTQYATFLNLGYQWVMEKMIIFNIHGGLGYGGYKLSGPYQQNLNDYQMSNFYDYLAAGPLAFSGGIDIGILFK